VIGPLSFFDVVFVTLSLWTFEPLDDRVGWTEDG
jgi:hypothetical protein